MQSAASFQLASHGCLRQQWLVGKSPQSQTGFLELLKEEFIADRFRNATDRYLPIHKQLGPNQAFGLKNLTAEKALDRASSHICFSVGRFSGLFGGR
jgi:hypothetical protein